MEEDNAYEEFTRSFIMKYGLISSEQDWTSAMQSSVTVDFGPAVANDVKVMCEMGTNHYILASYANLTGRTKLRFDMPKGIDELIVSVDGVKYAAQPGGRVNLVASRATTGAISRAEGDDDDPERLKWLMVAEDLGDVEDFDFNDFIAQIYVGTPTPIALDAYLDDYEDVDEGTVPLSRSGSRTVDSTDGDDSLVISALASGGTIDLWLHYRSATGEDYIIGPGNGDGYALTSTLDADEAAGFEWHQWFYYLHGINLGSTKIINTGRGYIDLQGVSITLPFKGNGSDGVIDSDFTAENYSVLVKRGNQYEIDRGFYITVYDYQAPEPDRYIVLGKVIGRTAKGDAPQMFLIPDVGPDLGWCWPIERVSVNSVYPSFLDWCKSPNSNQTWYLNPVGTAGVSYYQR